MRMKHRAAPDPTIAWSTDLRSRLVHQLDPATVSSVVATLASTGVVHGTVSAVALAATGGGTPMTTAMITATAAGHTAAKIGAGVLVAALTAGAAAATGHLPAGAQQFAANAAAHVGITLPRPEANIDAGVDVSISRVVSVGEAGRVGVVLDDDGLQLTSIDANAGYSAKVVAETADAIIVQFSSEARTSAVLLSRADGAITASIAGDAGAGAGLDTTQPSVEGSVDGELDFVLEG